MDNIIADAEKEYDMQQKRVSYYCDTFRRHFGVRAFSWEVWKKSVTWFIHKCWISSFQLTALYNELNKRIHEHDTAIVSGFDKPELTLQASFSVKNAAVHSGQVRSGMRAYTVAARSSLRRYSFGPHLAIAQANARPVMSISFR